MRGFFEGRNYFFNQIVPANDLQPEPRVKIEVRVSRLDQSTTIPTAINDTHAGQTLDLVQRTGNFVQFV